MSNFIEYHQYATECRSIAAKLHSGEQKSQLLTIAVAWEKLAADAAKRAGYLGDALADPDKLAGN